MRHLTDVEIEARIATRLKAVTARVERCELVLRVLLEALGLLAKYTPDRLGIDMAAVERARGAWKDLPPEEGS